jgi:hypothetical protein
MTRLVLCRTQAGALPPDRDLAAWHKALTAELARIGPVHAALLAAPETASMGLEWIAVGERAMPAASLPGNGLQALMAALGSILADIDGFVASGQSPLLASAWPALRRLPDNSYVYAVDGRPVLAAWGQAPADAAEWPDPLVAIMPQRAPVLPFAPPPGRANFGLIGAFLAAALLFGVLLPSLVLHPFTCTAPAAAIDQGNAALAQNAQLTTQLTQLEEQAAQNRAQCDAPPKPALPQNAWDSGRLDMLSGCWKLITNMTEYNIKTNAPMPISGWSICFDKLGKGTQTVTYQSGDVCTGPVQASFLSGHQMMIHEPSQCSGPSSTVIGYWICKRVSDSQADCVRTDPHFPGHVEGIFQR